MGESERSVLGEGWSSHAEERGERRREETGEDAVKEGAKRKRECWSSWKRWGVRWGMGVGEKLLRTRERESQPLKMLKFGEQA